MLRPLASTALEVPKGWKGFGAALNSLHTKRQLHSTRSLQQEQDDGEKDKKRTTRKFTMSFSAFKEIKDAHRKQARNTGLLCGLGGLVGTMSAGYVNYPQMYDAIDITNTGLPYNLDPIAVNMFSSLVLGYGAFKTGQYLQRKLSYALMRREKKTQYDLRESDLAARLVRHRTDPDDDDMEGKRITEPTDYARWLRRQRGQIRAEKKRLREEAAEAEKTEQPQPA
eukprot:comp11800_c0_seq1/m.6411 comp11800_c0_seq1/g.6411  ORF comp11800_c0_seq1/g.6411 comp11800_c0_seq1/m.6411 type:complete len:225 (-) comp11800_c0_seq1:60-734(-)